MIFPSIIYHLCNRLRLQLNLPSILLMILLGALLTSIAGCATGRDLSELHPPIMEQDELRRPYVKIAVIECTSERMGNLDALSTRDYDWAHRELRERAHLLGADAVLLPEVRIEHDTFFGFPSSQIRAKGIAVKFR